jgi:short subunit dehydrogenase-like uncharacterized protein
MLTVIEGAGEPTKMRKGGQIVAADSSLASLPFDDRPAPALPITWGDVSAAYYSTGIPNIETYIGTPAAIKQFQRLSRLRRLLSWGPMRALAKGYYGRTLKGPNEAQRAGDETAVWGEVSNAAGSKLALKLRTPAAYSLTVDSAVTAVARLLASDLAPGAYTPSLAFGPEFVLSLQGVEGPFPATPSDMES